MTKHFGAEIIETGPGSAVVGERKAAIGLLVGTAPIGDAHADPAVRAEHINKVVTVTNKEDAIAAFGAHQDGFTLPAALEDAFAQAGPGGIGEIDVVNVFDPDSHADPSAVSANDIIGGFTDAGQPTGLHLGYANYQRAGRFAKIIATPGFTGMAGVRATLQTLCNRTRGRALIDAPAGATTQDVIEARGPNGDFDFQFSDRRLVALWPHLVMKDSAAEGTRLSPYSATFLGHWLSTIVEYGYHHAPSNRPLVLEDTETPVTYIPGDKSDDIQLLRGAGIVTTEERYGKGPHSSGARSSAYPTDTDLRNLLHVQFIEDMLDEEVIEFLDQHKDRNMPLARIEFIEEQVNARLKTLASGDDPVLYDGHFRFDRTQTTKTSVANQQFFYRTDYAPVGIGETLTVDRNIDLNLIGNALGLAA